MASQYLTVPEVVEVLKLSEKTVYRLAEKGKLPAFKVGSAQCMALRASGHRLLGRERVRANRG